MTRQSHVGGPRTPRLVAIGVVAGGAAAAGPATGALWAQIAPPIHGVVALTHEGERARAYLGNEAEHFFVAPFLLLGLLGVLAVVTAALAWQWQAHRGPGMVAGLSAGLAASAALTALTGARLVRLRYGAVDVDAAPVTPDHRVHYFAEAPPVFFGSTPLQVTATLVLPVAIAALGYGLCATWTTRDDLGGYPPADQASGPASAPPPGLDVTAADGALPHR